MKKIIFIILLLSIYSFGQTNRLVRFSDLTDSLNTLRGLIGTGGVLPDSVIFPTDTTAQRAFSDLKYVDKTTAQTIIGQKTLSSTLILNASMFTTITDALIGDNIYPFYNVYTKSLALKIGSGGFSVSLLSPLSVVADRQIRLPDASGTVMLKEDSTNTYASKYQLTLKLNDEAVTYPDANTILLGTNAAIQLDPLTLEINGSNQLSVLSSKITKWDSVGNKLDTVDARLFIDSVYRSGSNIVFVQRDGTTFTMVDSVGAGGSGIANVIEDLTPQLGGDLDLNDQNIANTTPTFTLSPTEVSYLDGATSNIQDQIDNLTVGALIDGWDYPENYGADPTGVADSRAAFDTLFANYGLTGLYTDSMFIKFKPGAIYRFDTNPGDTGSTFIFNYNLVQGLKYLYVDGQGATLDFRDMVTASVFSLGAFGTGTHYSAAKSITVPILRGSTAIKVDTAISNNASKDDILYITNEATYWGAIDKEPTWLANSISNGEIVRINRVSNDTLYLYAGTKEYYPASDTTKIWLGHYPKIIMKNFKIVGEVKHKLDGTQLDQSGIVINGAMDSHLDNIEMRIHSTIDNYSHLDNIEITGLPYTALFLIDCIDTKITNCKIIGIDEGENSGNEYGIITSGGQNIIIDGNIIKGGRHAIDISSSEIPTRDVIITNNILEHNPDNTGSATLSSHPGCRDLVISDNIVHGTISLRNMYSTISNNLVISEDVNNDAGISMLNGWYVGEDTYFNIYGNQITGRDGGIQLYNGHSSGSPKANVNIKDNNIVGSSFLLVDAYTGGVGAFRNIIVQNNTYAQHDSATYIGDQVGVNFTAPTDSTQMDNFVFEGNTLDGGKYGLFIGTNGTTDWWSFKNFIVKNNQFKNMANLIRTEEGYDMVFADISNNVIDRGNTDQDDFNIIWMRDTTTAVTKVIGNTFINFGALGDAYVNLVGVKTYYGQSILINSTGTETDIIADTEILLDWAP